MNDHFLVNIDLSVQKEGVAEKKVVGRQRGIISFKTSLLHYGKGQACLF